MSEWISKNEHLTDAEMKNNANIIIKTLRNYGYADKTIAGILGNLQNESACNPGLYETGGSGYGICQWTPQTVLTKHCSILGVKPYTDGDVQVYCMDKEIKSNPSTVREWYTTKEFITPYYNSGATSDFIGITPTQFITNSKGFSASKLATLFMVAYLRPSRNPDTNHASKRRSDANKWLDYMGSVVDFTPRTSKKGMKGSKYWYSETNPYYPEYRLPNCTCYAWGRFWEISDVIPHLPTNNAGEWFDTIINYEKGSTPALGAVLCLYDPAGAGHVAIVEEIHDDYIVTSNSGYSRNPGTYDDPLYFWTDKNYQSNNYVPSWAKGYSFQGFIYNPEIPIDPEPSGSVDHMSYLFYMRRKTPPNRKRLIKIY